MSPGKPGTLDRLLRVRRLMEEISRAEVAHRRALQAEMESRTVQAEEAARAARSDAREALTAEMDWNGRWRLHCEDSDVSREQAERWRRRALHAGQAATEAEVLYMEDRRRRMQVEILLEEKAAAAALEESRREQQQFDDWFGMRRSARRVRRAEAAAPEAEPPSATPVPKGSSREV